MIYAIYLPPGNERERVAFAMLQEAAPSHPTYAGGDFNYDIEHPRDRKEEQVQRLVRAWLASAKASFIPLGTHTRQQGTSRSMLDAVAVPIAQLWRWEARTAWHSHLSDHAAVVARTADTTAPRGAPLTPAVFKSLPNPAVQDLRSRFRQLGLMFGLPETTVPDAAWISERPLDEHCMDNEDASSSSSPMGVHESADKVPANCGLMWQGYRLMDSLLYDWWRT